MHEADPTDTSARPSRSPPPGDPRGKRKREARPVPGGRRSPAGLCVPDAEAHLPPEITFGDDPSARACYNQSETRALPDLPDPDRGAYVIDRPMPNPETGTFYVRCGLMSGGAAVAYCRISACVLRRADENGVISFYGEAGVYRVQTEHRRKDTIWA